MYNPKEIKKYQTAQIDTWKEGSKTYKCIVQYGMHYIYGNSQPYFSITADTFRKSSKGGRWEEDGGGCQHNLIKSKLPELAELIPYHLSGQDGLPLYYLENGYYWYKNDLDVFKDYVRISMDESIPTVPEIELPVILNDNGTELDITKEEKEKIREKFRKQFITDWLNSRQSKLKQEFNAVMERFGVEYITQEEIKQCS